MRRWRELIVVQWTLLLALVVALPWGGGGFLLTYDMVWVPRWELSRDDLWGLGTALPRVVPSDAVVAVLSSVLDPGVLQRLVLVGAMVLGGVGAARLVDHLGLAPRLVAATYALWNPFVAERLVLGQWPVLVALGCLPWIVVALRNSRDVRWAVLTLALAGTALSAATGLMGLVVAVVVGLRAGVVRIVVLAAVVNAPWIVAGIVHSGALASDPAAAVGVFDAQPEGPLGRWGAVLALGGVWNTEVVPTSRTTATAAVLVAILWTVMLVGVVAMGRSRRGQPAALGVLGLGVLGLVGLAIASAGWVAPQLLEDAIGWRPELALLRDGTRYLALLVPLQVVALAHGVAALTVRPASGAHATTVWWRLVPAGIVLALPIAALPDLANGVADRVTPVDYPADWREARSAVAASAVPGDLLVLPFSAYRAPDWNEGRTVLAPAGKYFDRTTVVDDRLPVSGQDGEAQVIAGEDPRAARIAALLGQPTSGPAQLAAEGIGIVVLEPSATATDAMPPVLAGARELPLAPDGLRVFEIDGAVERTTTDIDRYTVTAAWVLAGLAVGLALVAMLRRGARRLLAPRAGS